MIDERSGLGPTAPPRGQRDHRRRSRRRLPVPAGPLVGALVVAGVVLSAVVPRLPAERPAAGSGAGGARVGRAPRPAAAHAVGPGVPVARPAAAPADPPPVAPAVISGPPVRQVWVQGDSVMAGAADTVRGALVADGWKAVVTGWPGLHLWAALPLFSQVKPQMGSVAVVELGDNDCCNGQIFGHQIDQAMQILAGMHVIWLTGTAHRPGQQATEAAIVAAASRWPNLEVADWAAVVAQHHDAVYADGVHLTPAGQALMASFVRSALDSWYQRASRPPTTIVVPAGAAPAIGPATGVASDGGVVGGVAAPDGAGYWLAGGDGGVFSFGSARFLGSEGATVLRAPVVGMAATPDGGGYWLVARDGGVFSFGDAPFVGSAAGLSLHAPVVGMAPTPDGRGYWLVGADGGVLSFGDAPFLGSAARLTLGGPIVGMAPTRDGRGYWLVGADGGVLSFGDAPFLGSLAGRALPAPIRSVGATSTGRGYWLSDTAGRVYGFGDAPSDTRPAPGPGGTTQLQPYFSVIIPRPGGGYWLAGAVAGG